MSMNAMFVQVEDAEIGRFEADPDLVEALFASQTLPTAGLLNMTATMQERVRAVTPAAGLDNQLLTRVCKQLQLVVGLDEDLVDPERSLEALIPHLIFC